MDDFIQRSPFPVPYVRLTDVYSFLKPFFHKYGTKDALIDAGSGKTYTYLELEDVIETVAFNLSKHGVKKGDTIVCFAPNSVEYSVMILATWRLGAVFCSVNHLLTSHEVESLLAIAEPRYVFTDSRRLETFLEGSKNISFVKTVFVRDPNTGYVSFASLLEPSRGQRAPNLTDINLKEKACILFSSGTTGLPKAVMLSNENLVTAWTWWTQPYTSVANYGHQVLFLPLSHAFGLFLLCGGIVVGGTSIVMEQFDLIQFLENMSKYKIESLILVPPLVVLLAKHPAVDQYDLSHLKTIMCGAAPLGEDTIVELQERLKRSIHFRQGYGLTETSACCTLSPMKDSPISCLPPQSSGYPVTGLELKVVDIKTGKTLGPDQQGEIWVRGPNNMIGYAKNPTATANTIDAEEWLHTGDIGYYKKDSSFYIVDRLKELIKYKGYQVAPAELEDLLLSHPLVADTAVIGIPDIEAGEIPLALIVRKEPSLSEQDVINFVAEKAAPYKRLRGGVKFVDAIPKSPSGKILRNQIRKTFANFKGKL